MSSADSHRSIFLVNQIVVIIPVTTTGINESDMNDYIYRC